MKFHEHIIRVKMPNQSGPSRDALWLGIVEFAHHPECFYGEIASSEAFAEHVTEAGVCEFVRRVRFHAGNLSFEERVTLDEAGGIYRSFFSGDDLRPASDFTMKLEEPEQGSLFVRLIYNEQPSAEVDGDARAALFAALRRQAYEAKDQQIIDAILQRISVS